MIAVTTTVVMVGLTAACGSSTSQAGGSTSDGAASHASTSNGSGGSQGTDYPLTLKTPYGTTTLKSEPKRVAIAGQVGDTENVLSLGVVPVLAPKFQLQWPWIDDGQRSKVEQTYEGSSTNELPLEQFAASRPDVIIAISDTKLAEHYDELSKIAPVVALPDKKSNTQFDWKRSLRLTGKALNRSTEATQEISATEQKITQVKKNHPEFDGTSISFVIDYGQGNGLTFYNGKGSPGEDLLTSLSFAPADHADEFTGERPQVSQELLPRMNSDVLVMSYRGGRADQKKMESNRLFQKIPAVQDDRYVALLPKGGSSPLAWSMAKPTATNLQWSIDYLVPKLAPAAKKVE